MPKAIGTSKAWRKAWEGAQKQGHGEPSPTGRHRGMDILRAVQRLSSYRRARVAQPARANINILHINHLDQQTSSHGRCKSSSACCYTGFLRFAVPRCWRILRLSMAKLRTRRARAESALLHAHEKNGLERCSEGGELATLLHMLVETSYLDTMNAPVVALMASGSLLFVHGRNNSRSRTNASERKHAPVLRT